jgi:hypothetical protein
MFCYKLVGGRKANTMAKSYSGGNSLLLNPHRLQTRGSLLLTQFYVQAVYI